MLKVLPIIIVSYVVGLGIEFVFAQLRGHEINEGFLVSGMLIPLVMPVETPLWMIAIATAFAVIFGKEVFGGTGMNIWNPALIARAFLFFAYPAQMSGNSVWVSLKDSDKVIDGFTGATPMADAAAGNINFSVSDAFFGFIPGSIGETSTLAILLGAVLLIITSIGSWKIMASAFAGGAVMGIILNIFAGSNVYMSLPFLATLNYWRICIWCRIYGHRSGIGLTNRSRKMDLRLSDWSAGYFNPRGKPGLPRRNDALHPADEHLCPAYRSLRGEQ